MSGVRSAWPDHPGYRIDIVPCSATARVVVGGVVVAESDSAIRVIETDHVERVYFPEGDVTIGLLAPNNYETICPFKGRASYWSYKGPGQPVENLFWAYRQPFAEVAGIAGHVGVYHERAAVEIETTWPDGTASVNRFPAWGDQVDLMTVLEPVQESQGRFVAPGYHLRHRNVVEGGQLLGQAIIAASRVQAAQRATWASMTFTRAADFEAPVDIDVEPLRQGRTFSTLATRSTQRGKLVAPGLVLFDSGAGDVMRESAPLPDVPGPAESQPYDMGVTGRDLRIVDAAYSPDPDKIGPPVIRAWVRWRDNPSELCLRQALVAQATTHWTIAAGMLPHQGLGEARAHVSLSTGPVAISLAFHDDAPLDRWFLYSTRATWSGAGLVHGVGHIWTETGGLIASYALQAMVREMLAGVAGRDGSNAM